MHALDVSVSSATLCGWSAGVGNAFQLGVENWQGF